MNPLKALLKGERTGVRPVWLMRQSGRILPEYRTIKSKFPSFSGMIRNTDAVIELTLLPIKHLEVDALIIFKDLLTIVEVFNMRYDLNKKGIYIDREVVPGTCLCSCSQEKICETFEHLGKAIRTIKKEYGDRYAVIGFAPSPISLFLVMTSGSTSDHSRSIYFMYEFSLWSAETIKSLSDTIIQYIKFQYECGCDVIQIFDSYASSLPYPLYRHYIGYFLDALREETQGIPIIFYPRYQTLAYLELHNYFWGIAVDEKTPPEIIPQNSKVIMQGNLDPAILFCSKEVIEKFTRRMLSSFPKDRHIVNLGSGVNPATSLRNIQHFIEICRKYGDSGTGN